MTARGIVAMAYYEFLMHWRRRTLIGLMMGMLVFLGINMLVLREGVPQTQAPMTAELRQAVTMTIVSTSWAGLAMMLAFILPITLADTIPLDRQHGTRELLDSAMVPVPTYLAGKLLGAWISVMAGLVGVVAISAVGWWVIVTPYDVGQYVGIWLIGGAIIAALNGSLGVLLAAGQPNRRRGVILVLVLMVVLVILFPVSPTLDGWRDAVNPLRTPLLNYFFMLPMRGAEQLLSTIGNPSVEMVWLTISAGLGQIVLAGVYAWAHLRWQADRV